MLYVQITNTTSQCQVVYTMKKYEWQQIKAL